VRSRALGTLCKPVRGSLRAACILRAWFRLNPRGTRAQGVRARGSVCVEPYGVWGSAGGAGAYQTSRDLDATGWGRTATVPRGWDGAGKGQTVSPRSVERCGHGGPCPSRGSPNRRQPSPFARSGRAVSSRSGKISGAEDCAPPWKLPDRGHPAAFSSLGGTASPPSARISGIENCAPTGKSDGRAPIPAVTSNAP
jgi:hypothetical protein